LLDALSDKSATVAKHKIHNNSRGTTRHNNRRDKRETIGAAKDQPANTGTDTANPSRRAETATTRHRHAAHGDKPLSPGDNREPDQGSRKP